MRQILFDFFSMLQFMHFILFCCGDILKGYSSPTGPVRAKGEKLPKETGKIVIGKCIYGTVLRK